MSRPRSFRLSPPVLALVLTALSFCVVGGRFLSLPYKPPFGGLSGTEFTDHSSHMNAARLFTLCGTCVWTLPVSQRFPSATTEERRQVSEELRPYIAEAEIFSVPGWTLEKPLMLNWSHLPRPYPPGVLLLVAPVSLAYHFTSLSFFGAMHLLILGFLLSAHVGFYFVLRGALESPGRTGALGLLGGVLLYSETVRWSLEGIYDVAMLAPLVLCGRFLHQRRGLAALVAYCAAAFLHYRAFFFAPLPLYAAYLILRERQWREWRARDWCALAVAVVLGGASLYTFWLVSPSLPLFPRSNPLALHARNTAFRLMLLLGTLAVAAFVYARAWLDVALLGWASVMLTRILQIQHWHALALLMWL
ncbi:MAG TPA: hypothetical protein VF794_37860, partial [Archangium sp.]|uniref:hypothetical protein n=1 Tax=Archangium sp. TaxID=1872627 RepID=UPI002ED91417